MQAYDQHARAPPRFYRCSQAFNDGCDHYNLQPTAYFWEKVVQIYDMMVVRHGFMIVGLPFSGKTMAWKVLAFALGLLHTRYRALERPEEPRSPPSEDTDSHLAESLPSTHTEARNPHWYRVTLFLYIFHA